MSPDKHCSELIRLGFVEINPKLGIAYSVRKGNKIIGCLNTKGYSVATLHLNGKRKQIKVHRLIWIYKNGIPPIGSLIDHKNRIKNDNRISNLRLVDNRQNALNRRKYQGVNNPAAKINQQVADQIRLDYSKIHSHRKLAKKYRISVSAIDYIIRGEKWKSR